MEEPEADTGAEDEEMETEEGGEPHDSCGQEYCRN